MLDRRAPDEAYKNNALDDSLLSLPKHSTSLKSDSFLSAICSDKARAFSSKCSSDAIECALDTDGRLYVYVPMGHGCQSGAAIEEVVQIAEELPSNDLPCSEIVVYIHKTHKEFADWVRRFLYTGFTFSRRKNWNDKPLEDGVLCLALPMNELCSSDSGGSATVFSEDDSDSETDDDWDE